jgi:hypothetical protein
MDAILQDSHPMLVYSAINERPTVYTAMGKIPTFATSPDVKGPRREMDFPVNGTSWIT